MCFDYRLETLGGWKVGKGGRGEGGDLEFPWDARQGKGDTRVARKSGIELKKSTFKDRKENGGKVDMTESGIYL